MKSKEILEKLEKVKEIIDEIISEIGEEKEEEEEPIFRGDISGEEEGLEYNPISKVFHY